jgi:hypothetical protein
MATTIDSRSIVAKKSATPALFVSTSSLASIKMMSLYGNVEDRRSSERGRP